MFHRWNSDDHLIDKTDSQTLFVSFKKNDYFSSINMTQITYKNCQSCGMPLSKDAQNGGTEKDGTNSIKYCSYCYTNGEFIGGNVTLKEFSELSKKGMIEGGHNKIFAWFFSRPFMLGHLERWKNKN